jgi:RHS repeat-associated protein
MTDSVMGTWSYTYDDFNRLTNGTANAGVDDGLALSWTYDRYGNRWAQNASGSGNASAVQPQLSFANSNQVVGWSYDADGNLLNDGRNSYAYDAEGRVCAVQSSNGNIIGYVYDAEGRRVAKTGLTGFNCNLYENDEAVNNRYLLDLGGNQVTEFDGGDSWSHSNVWVGGRLLATYEGPSESKPNTYHFHLTDWLTTQRLQTNAAGNAEEDCYSYPFGDGLTCTGSDATEHHFTSKMRDTESGLDYFGARYYSSTMGRWLTPDPGWFIFANILDPQSLSLYGHALNNPLVWIDTDGLELVRAVLANGQTVVVDRSVAPELISMVREATNAGLIVTVSSGFRSYSKQAELYARWKNGQSKYPAAPPGRSAHNGGLAVDFRPNLNANQMNTLAQLGHQNGLNYAGQKDGVHFGPYYAWEVNWDIVHENMNSQPDDTIVDGGVTTVVVNETDDTTTIDVDNSTIIPDQITPIDTQNLDLTPQPPPPQQDQQSQ